MAFQQNQAHASRNGVLLQSLRHVRYLIFDLDDTLFDYRRSAREAMGAVFEKINEIYKIPVKDLDAEYQLILKGVDVHAFNDGRKSTEYRRERFEQLLMRFGVKDEQLITSLLEIYNKKLLDNTALFSQTTEVLEGLGKRYKLILATEGPSDAQNLIIDTLGIREYFIQIFISGEIRRRKDDGSMFKHIAETIGMKPDEAVVIGDSMRRDILGARAANMAAIWINRKDEKADLEVSEVKDIKELTSVL